jgi:hypothetical protein
LLSPSGEKKVVSDQKTIIKKRIQTIQESMSAKKEEDK